MLALQIGEAGRRHVITAPLLGAWAQCLTCTPGHSYHHKTAIAAATNESAPTDMNSERRTGLRVRRRRASPTLSFDGLEPRQRDEAAETFRRRRLAVGGALGLR